MTDIDIENCHLVIMLQILKHNNYNGKYAMFEDYCYNRDAWRKEIIAFYKLEEHKRALFPTSDSNYISFCI